jgi:hypothetical protein
MGVERNGKEAAEKAAGSDQRSKRLVLLTTADEQSAVRRVLVEYPAGGVKGSELHAALKRVAREHPGSMIAAEWLGSVGWTRFLWCRNS